MPWLICGRHVSLMLPYCDLIIKRRTSSVYRGISSSEHVFLTFHSALLSSPLPRYRVLQDRTCHRLTIWMSTENWARKSYSWSMLSRIDGQCQNPIIMHCSHGRLFVYAIVIFKHTFVMHTLTCFTLLYDRFRSQMAHFTPSAACPCSR